MKLSRLLGRAGLAAMAIVSAVAIATAANLSFSTGAFFVPTGPALFHGSDLNVMVTAINNLQNSVISGDPVLFGNHVNKLSVTSGTTGLEPYITSGGGSSDTNIGVAMFGKGAGNACLGGQTCASAAAQFVTTASAVDFVRVTGAATASPATVTELFTGTDTNVNGALTPKGAGVIKIGGTIATCSGTTTATCQGQRFVASVTGLSTAASTLATAMTVTDASVVSSSSIVVCQAQGYAGTGVPVVVNVTPGTGSVAFAIQNVSTGAALNATVAVGCFVFGT